VRMVRERNRMEWVVVGRFFEEEGGERWFSRKVEGRRVVSGRVRKGRWKAGVKQRIQVKCLEREEVGRLALAREQQRENEERLWGLGVRKEGKKGGELRGGGKKEKRVRKGDKGGKKEATLSQGVRGNSRGGYKLSGRKIVASKDFLRNSFKVSQQPAFPLTWLHIEKTLCKTVRKRAGRFIYLPPAPVQACIVCIPQLCNVCTPTTCAQCVLAHGQ